MELTPDIEAVLWSALEYFEDREDVIDGDYGIPAANKEMILAIELRAAMNAAGMRLNGKLITREGVEDAPPS